MAPLFERFRRTPLTQIERMNEDDLDRFVRRLEVKIEDLEEIMDAIDDAIREKIKEGSKASGRKRDRLASRCEAKEMELGEYEVAICDLELQYSAANYFLAVKRANTGLNNDVRNGFRRLFGANIDDLSKAITEMEDLRDQRIRPLNRVKEKIQKHLSRTKRGIPKNEFRQLMDDIEATENERTDDLIARTLDKTKKEEKV